MFDRECRECGKSFQAKRNEAGFCSVPCRKEYHNRRYKRGAEAYDLLMTLRFDRKLATEEKLLGHLWALASAFREGDKANRAGRRSWDTYHHRSLPLAYSQNAGDGR